MSEREKMNELNDEQLEDVSGGVKMLYDRPSLFTKPVYEKYPVKYQEGEENE